MKNTQYVTTNKERFSYGGYFVGQNIIFMLVLQYLMLFYTDVVGLSAAAVGTLFLVARVWDAINDPIMGIIVDKAKLKGGKFKPWINLVVFILPIITALLFVNPSGSEGTKLLYAYVTYILWGMIYTISDVPIFALATVMTDKLDERVQLISIGRLAAGVASMLTAMIAMPVITKLGWTQAAILLSAIAMVVMIPIKFFAVERTVKESTETTDLKSIFKFVSSNKYLMVFYIGMILSGLTNTILVSTNYFAIYNLGSANHIMALSLLGSLPMAIVPIFLPKLISKLGKKNLILISLASFIIISITFYFIGYENIVLVYVITFIRGIFMNMPMLMLGMITADCIEYGEYTTGNRAEGIAFSMQTFSTKLSMALSGAVGGYILQLVGYQANVDQTPETLQGLWQMNTIIPTIGYIVMFIIILAFYKLKEVDVQNMVETMKLRKKKNI